MVFTFIDGRYIGRGRTFPTNCGTWHDEPSTPGAEAPCWSRTDSHSLISTSAKTWKALSLPRHQVSGIMERGRIPWWREKTIPLHFGPCDNRSLIFFHRRRDSNARRQSLVLPPGFPLSHTIYSPKTWKTLSWPIRNEEILKTPGTGSQLPLHMGPYDCCSTGFTKLARAPLRSHLSENLLSKKKTRKTEGQEIEDKDSLIIYTRHELMQLVRCTVVVVSALDRHI